MDWVCEDAWIPAMSQSIFFLGAVPGMLFFGWFCDHYGRLPTIIITNLLSMITGLLTPFATGHTTFFIIRFLMGLSFNTFFTVPYTLAIEYVGKDKRSLVGNLGLAVCLTLSGIYQPWLIKYLGDWKIFTWLMFSQMGLVVLTPILMPESCRWLISIGEGEKAVKIIRRIARINGREVPEGVYSSVLALCRRQKVAASNR